MKVKRGGKPYKQGLQNYALNSENNNVYEPFFPCDASQALHDIHKICFCLISFSAI